MLVFIFSYQTALPAHMYARTHTRRPLRARANTGAPQLTCLPDRLEEQALLCYEEGQLLECLLHLFSFLDKDSRRNLSLTCIRLREAFLDPRLWSLLHFLSPCELKRNNYILGLSLRHLSICWHSSRVKVCNIEDWMKTTFQRDLCSKHEKLVSHFLEHVCHMCPNLLSLTLSGCGHITDLDVISVLRSCRQLQKLCLENCCRVTDAVLQAVVTHGNSLVEVRLDFCRNITQMGLEGIRQKKPGVQLSAERSAGMIPDSQPEEKLHIRRALQKVLVFS